MFTIETVKLNLPYQQHPLSHMNKLPLPVTNNMGTCLGSGAFGAAFEHKTDHGRVYKVASPNDGGYRVYIEELAKFNDQKSVHLPFVFAAWDFVFTGAKGEDIAVLVVEMERLQENHKVGKENDAWHFAKFMRDDTKKTIDGQVPNIAQKAAKKFIQTLFYTFTNPNLRIDLHTGNVMVRSDGTLVVTDPFTR